MTENFRSLFVWFGFFLFVCFLFFLKNLVLVDRIQYENNINHLGLPLWEEGWGTWTPLYSSCHTFRGCTLLLHLFHLLHSLVLCSGNNWWVSESSNICCCFPFIAVVGKKEEVPHYVVVGTGWSSNENLSKDWDSNFGWTFGLRVSASFKHAGEGDYYTERLNWTESVWGYP